MYWQSITSGILDASFVAYVVQLYCSTDMATAWKNYHFLLSKRSDFLMVVNLSICVILQTGTKIMQEWA